MVARVIALAPSIFCAVSPTASRRHAASADDDRPPLALSG
jgi:hypothetical protein